MLSYFHLQMCSAKSKSKKSTFLPTTKYMKQLRKTLIINHTYYVSRKHVDIVDISLLT